MKKQIWWGGGKIEVTAIEYDPKIAALYKKLNPNDTVIVGDAHQYLLDHYSEFDFVWSSPPCQSHSKMIRSGRNRVPRFPDFRLYEEIVFLQYNFKGFWVVENVVPYYDPLVKPVSKLGRHLFWGNFEISQTEIPEFKNMMNRQNMEAKKQLQEWLGIFFEENIYYDGNHCATQILRNCVHPNLGLHVFNCLPKDAEVVKKETPSNGQNLKLF